MLCWLWVAWGFHWQRYASINLAAGYFALATLGVLLLVGGRPAWSLWPIPVAWCLVSGTTLWAMEAPDFALVPLAALLAVGLAVGGVARRSR